MSRSTSPREASGPTGGSDVHLRVHLTERGYRSVLLHLAALRLRFVPPVLGMFGMLAYAAGMRTEAIALFGGVVAIPVVVWGYLAWLSGSPSSRPLYTPVEYRLTEAGVGYRSAEGDGEIGWDSVVRWREAAGHLLIYVSGSNYLLIPLEDVAHETREALEAVLRERVGPPGRRAGRLR